LGRKVTQDVAHGRTPRINPFESAFNLPRTNGKISPVILAECAKTALLSRDGMSDTPSAKLS
jgi:hypothetical protein